MSETDLSLVHEALAEARFVDGKATAGWSARLVKDNLQAVPSTRLEAVAEMIGARLMANTAFVLAQRPKSIIGPLFSRYEAGHAYGSHVDDALLDGRRSDASFTLFLAEPESYEGGELIVDTPLGEEAVKLPAGSVITYSATLLHRVAPVTSGVRLAAVGWVRSLVRDAAKRDLLFDLDVARRRLFEREGKTPEADLLARCSANLLRMWAED